MSVQFLHQFFEQAADKYPQHIALICDEQTWTYDALDRRVNQLARYLLRQGVAKDDVIGILIERSSDCYIAILAVLKVGATYVPIETEHPDERINYIFSDMDYKVVLISSSQYTRSALQLPPAILIDQIQSLLDLETTGRVSLDNNINLTGDTLSYIIYTSGSTGKPKGVQISHSNICYYIYAASEIYNMNANDIVYQGFSLAFDASLEEIWMAFANGATLIACTDKNTRSGVGLIDFLKQNKISFFSTIPTLLSILEGDVPSLRLLVLGGETCEETLVERWSRDGLKIINTYGPTEATVIATYQEYTPNKLLTIGQPLPGCEVLILDENLSSVKKGEPGELCITGPGLARAYVNRPEISAIKFVAYPEHPDQRIYRTGDLAKIIPNGEIQYLGRIDDQVKLRGFRIELNEIETVIMKFPGVNHAVVVLQTLDEPALVAYVQVLKNCEIDFTQLRNFLIERLPHYMVPSIYECVKLFPLLSNGKIDRKNLPKPLKKDRSLNYIAPKTDLERHMALIWEEVLCCSSISVQANFFEDLGGHSLAAAKIVSLLRKIIGLENMSLLELYQYPTIENLALQFSGTYTGQKAINSEDDIEKKPDIAKVNWKYRLCGVMQFIGTYVLFGLRCWPILFIMLGCDYFYEKNALFSLSAVEFFIASLVGLPIFLLLIPVIAKWLLLGRIKPGHYPLWGWFYCRWWFVCRIQHIVMFSYLSSSPLWNVYCKLMGAKIGHNCSIQTSFINIFDLLCVGDNSCVGYDAGLFGYIVEEGLLKIGPISIGKNCYVGMKSMLSIDTTMKDNTILSDQSMLPSHKTIPAGECWSGSPARLDKAAFEKSMKALPKDTTYNFFSSLGYDVLGYMVFLFNIIVYYTAWIPGILLIDYFYIKKSYVLAMVVGIPSAASLFFIVFTLSIIIIKKTCLKKVLPGYYKIKSSWYHRYKLVETLVDTPDLWVMGESLIFPIFMRLLGAHIGKHVEIAELLHVCPDLFTIKERAFVTSSCYIGAPRYYCGYLTVAPCVIGVQSFIGNDSLVPIGTTMGDNCLLGASSIAPQMDHIIENDTTWFGSPPFLMPKRQVINGFSDKTTFNPTRVLFVKRFLMECIRIILPSSFFLVRFLGLLFLIDALYPSYSLSVTIASFPIFDGLLSLILAGAGISLKWALMGRYRETKQPLWSMFVWKSDILERFHTGFLGPIMLEHLQGTPFLGVLFRLLGVKVGSRVFFDTIDLYEFDLVEIGDDVSLNVRATIQTHLFEDRIYKTGPIKIKNRCTIGDVGILLYGSTMEEGSKLGNLSLLMKGEQLPAHTYWEGVPAQTISQLDRDQSE